MWNDIANDAQKLKKKHPELFQDTLSPEDEAIVKSKDFSDFMLLLAYKTGGCSVEEALVEYKKK